MSCDPPTEHPRRWTHRWAHRWTRWWASRLLRTQLIVQNVVLLAAVCVALSVVTGLVVHRLQIAQLDRQLGTTSGRVVSFDKTDGKIQVPGSPPVNNPLTNAPGVDAQTVLTRIVGETVTDSGLRDTATGAQQNLSPQQTTALRGLPLDRPVTRHVPGLGDYRLFAARSADGDKLIIGRPLAPLQTAQLQLAAVEAGVSLVGLVLAAVFSGLITRRTLRPLERVAATAQRVAELPLDRGEVALAVRVPEADPRTEVGRVGAALNRMIGHVAEALAARHAGETRLRRFSADVSHELRTPLAAIRGYAELTRRRAGVQPEVADAMRRVESETMRMTVLVEDLLRLARLDSERPPATAPVDLSWLVIDAVSDARVAGPDHGWRLDLPQEPVIVTGDEAGLHRAVANLLANGLVHTPPGTTVTTGLAVSGDHAELSVVDDGPGIPAQLLPQVFDRFTQGAASRRYSAGGGGLGLAIVKAIVEGHGGGVGVDSRPGRTRFTVRLPRPVVSTPPRPD
ncbi:ATP-binding protein [Dactylosporangium sp. NPDC049525]|uniref:sensor histidine kinase n=1 Tax=Dactylosporangium sp. NPDC049525 TaxID=3154730 RepID=UPI003444A73C